MHNITLWRDVCSEVKQKRHKEVEKVWEEVVQVIGVESG